MTKNIRSEATDITLDKEENIREDLMKILCQ